MRIYKHVKFDDAERFANGAIRLGTHAHYRADEGMRGDRLEGLTEFATGNNNVHEFQWNENAGMAQLFGFPLDAWRAGRAKNVIIHNATVHLSVEPMLLFCASDEPNYDLGTAIFAISKPTLFARRVGKALGLSHKADMRRVEYSKRSYGVLGQPVVQPDPFVKDTVWCWEREFRIGWPVPSDFAQVVDITVPQIVPLLERLR